MILIMLTTPDLIARIEAHCAAVGMSPSTFCRKTVNDGKLWARLTQKNGRVTIETCRKLIDAMPGEAGPAKKGRAAA